MKTKAGNIEAWRTKSIEQSGKKRRNAFFSQRPQQCEHRIQASLLAGFLVNHVSCLIEINQMNECNKKAVKCELGSYN